MLGVGVAGYGYWGPRLSRVIAANDACRLVGICESGDRLLRARRTHPDAQCSADFGDLLANPTVDAVALATPAETHVALALAALRAGKHVFSEKPLALSVADVDALCAEAAANARVLMVDHVYLFSPPVVTITELHDNGELPGMDRYRSVRVNMAPTLSIGVVFDLVVHDAAILDRLRGCSPESVRAEPAPHSAWGPGDVIRAVFTYGDGFEADITAACAAPAKRRLVELDGAGWTIAFDDDDPVEKLRLTTAGSSVSRPVPYATDEPLACAVDHFVGCVRGIATPLADGAAARRVVRILEAAAQSLERGGESIPVAMHAVTT